MTTGPEFPRPTRSGPGHQVPHGQRSSSLDGPWRFLPDPENTGLDRGITDPGFDDSDWDRLAVPGHWDLHDRYADHRGGGCTAVTSSYRSRRSGRWPGCASRRSTTAPRSG